MPPRLRVWRDRGLLLLAVLVAATALAALPRESVAGAYATTLEGRTTAQRHNARLAVQRLNGAVIPAGEVFSFNGRVGTFSRDRGYRKAPVSYNGQLIDDWGGGVCQASTTLYNAALLAGMDILERHRHQFQPSYVPPGRDAAVAFSNIDLRFRNPHPYSLWIQAQIESGMLQVKLVGSGKLAERPQVFSRILEAQSPATFTIPHEERRRHIRNSGKRGWEVVVYRITGARREMVSKDTYPVMHRVVEDSGLN